ncbi:MAG: MFS transporter [Crocosphaera sp.]|nr:MFS transporter [Crocosphaera sp.]
MQVFLLIWFGQLVSLIGSGLTNFALGVWVYQTTGSTTQYALISLFTTLPLVLISPFAGVLVDRWDRRLALILSDSGAALSTFVIALLLITGNLQIPYIYLMTAVGSAFSAFQWPAYSAVSTLLVPKQHLSRARGMISMGRAIAQLISPVLAGVVLTIISLKGVILTDFATFLTSLLILCLIRLPKLPKTPSVEVKHSSLLNDLRDAWDYLYDRRGLLALVIFFTINNFLTGIVIVLATPLILSFASASVLGTVMSISSSGMLFGGLIMSVWGGPKRYIQTVFTFTLLSRLCLISAGLRPSIPLITLSAFLYFLSLPIIGSCCEVLFQKKVPSHLQGRVFALNQALLTACLPAAYAVAGPLADHIFEPFMSSDSVLAQMIGRVLGGVGPGRGIGLLMVVFGFVSILLTVAAYQYPRLQRVESEVPDAIEGELSN